MGHLNFKRLSFAASGTGSRQATLGHHNSKGISGGFFVTKHETHFYGRNPIQFSNSKILSPTLKVPYLAFIFSFLFVGLFCIHLGLSTGGRWAGLRSRSAFPKPSFVCGTHWQVILSWVTAAFYGKKHGKSWNILKQKHISKTPHSYNRLMCIIHRLS